jgi:hypothetical protein
VRRGLSEAAAQAASGVAWSGLGAGPPAGRSEAELRADAEAARARAEAFAADPRGRLLAALSELEAVGFAAEAERARAAWRRGFADPAARPSFGEIACAGLALNEIPTAAAREARRALYEIQLEAHARKAA